MINLSLSRPGSMSKPMRVCENKKQSPQNKHEFPYPHMQSNFSLKWEELAWVRHSSTWEELDKFKCLEAECREKPWKVRARTYGTKSPSRSEALRFIDSAKSPSTKMVHWWTEPAFRPSSIRTEDPTCANHVDVLTVRSVFFECPLSTSSVVSRVDWKACA